MTTFVRITAQPKEPFVLNQGCSFQIGAFDDQNLLYNITDDSNLTIEVVAGKVRIQYIGLALIITPLQLGNIVFRFKYTGIEYLYAVIATANLIVPSIPGLRGTTYNALPPQVYSKATNSSIYAKVHGIATIFNSLYADLRQVFLDFFPPFTANRNWQVMLDNYYSWQDSYDFGLVVQLFNNISTKRGNVYDTTLLISQYIYARVGLELYVFIQQDELNPDTSWILNKSYLGVSTYLGPDGEEVHTINIYIKISSLFTEFLNELSLFIEKILPVDANFNIITTVDFAQFGLTVEVGDVYDLDPRLFVPYALRYNNKTFVAPFTASVYDAQALCNPYNPYFLYALNYSPPGGIYSLGTGTITLTVEATFLFEGNFYYQDVTNNTSFLSEDENVLTMNGNIATLISDGTSLVTATWDNTNVQHLFVITLVHDSWVLGQSYLGVDTYLIN